MYAIRSYYVFLCACSVILAVVLNRFNVFLIGVNPGNGYNYFPSVGEIAITLAFVAFGVLLYKIGVNYLPILEEQAPDHEPACPFAVITRSPIDGGPGSVRPAQLDARTSLPVEYGE